MAERWPRAVVLGSNGQDGSYLCEVLAERGVSVTGLGRQPSPRYPLPDGAGYRRVDLRDGPALAAALEEIDPAAVFHVAAVHGASGFTYEEVWRDALAVNVAALHTALEHARLHEGVSVHYASSSKVFGPLRGVVSEDSPRASTCLYSITKNAAGDLVDYYRRTHAVRANVALLFNHESPRRAASYFIPTLLAGLRACEQDPARVLELNTLDFFCDWGSAREYMELFVELAARAPAEDAVIATGTTTRGADLVQRLFASRGLDAAARVRARAPPRSPEPFRVNTDKLRRLVGRVPARGIFEVCEEILEGM